MALLIPSIGIGALVGGSLLWGSFSRLVRHGRPARGDPPHEPPTGVRILRNAEEITIISRRAADREYRMAQTLWSRGEHYARLSEGQPDHRPAKPPAEGSLAGPVAQPGPVARVHSTGPGAIHDGRPST